MHMMEIMAFKKGVSIYATQYTSSKGEWCLYIFDNKLNVYIGSEISNDSFKSKHDAITKAAEWVLKQTKEKP